MCTKAWNTPSLVKRPNFDEQLDLPGTVWLDFNFHFCFASAITEIFTTIAAFSVPYANVLTDKLKARHHESQTTQIGLEIKNVVEYLMKCLIFCAKFILFSRP
jgi:hypothetical protein